MLGVPASYAVADWSPSILMGSFFFDEEYIVTDRTLLLSVRAKLMRPMSVGQPRPHRPTAPSRACSRAFQHSMVLLSGAMQAIQ